MLADNAKKEFDNALNDFADTARDMDNAIQDSLGEIGKSLLPKLLDWSKALNTAFDPDTWQEEFNNFQDWLKDKFDQAGDWWDQAQKDFGDWFIPFAKDFGDLVKLPWEGKYHIVDPMILDLDGDGIETIAAGNIRARCLITIKTASARPRAG